jgi:hypothetical protein
MALVWSELTDGHRPSKELRKVRENLPEGRMTSRAVVLFFYAG